MANCLFLLNSGTHRSEANFKICPNCRKEVILSNTSTYNAEKSDTDLITTGTEESQ